MTEPEFPLLVYKSTGPHQRLGGTYNYVGVNDMEDLKAKINDGWFLTIEELADEKPKTVLKSKKP